MSIDSSDACDRPGIGPAGRRARAFLAGRHFFRQLPSGARAGIGVIWFAFVVFPVINALGVHGSVLEHALTIVGAAGFVAVYVTMVATWHFNRTSPLTLLLFAAMLVLAGALTLAQSSSWGFLFIYCTACSWLVVRKQLGIYVMALCAALAGGLPALAGANGSTVISFIASAAGVGLLMLLMSDLRLRNLQLSEARAELAELAVAQERERFARDLHDLLGHSLSVITLKAELAGRMLTDRPSDAAREVAELEQVARSALGEVRDAVSGYRQPTLEGELAGARMALSAAGIEADVQQAHVSLDPVVEAVLAWTVREGATNVIRHSGARHCTLRVTASLTDAGVEVTDDGGAGAGAVAASGGGRGGATGEADDGRGGAVWETDDGRGGAMGETDDGRGGAVGEADDSPGGAVGEAEGELGGVAAASLGPPANGRRAVGGAAAAAVGTGGKSRGGDWAADGRDADPDAGNGPATGRSVAGKHATGGHATGGHATAGRVTGGHGLAGLAERARLVNGTLEAGAVAGGGYRLAVTVPVSHA